MVDVFGTNCYDIWNLSFHATRCYLLAKKIFTLAGFHQSVYWACEIHFCFTLFVGNKAVIEINVATATSQFDRHKIWTLDFPFYRRMRDLPTNWTVSEWVLFVSDYVKSVQICSRPVLCKLFWFCTPLPRSSLYYLSS